MEGRPSSDTFGSFQEALDFLEKAVDFEKRTSVKYTDRTFDLSRTRALLAHLGDPHLRLKVIHLAGTKGKGTTAAFIASCLRSAGLRTGLHTSPHLVSICERLVVDGSPVREAEFCRLLGLVKDYIARKRAESRNDAPTYFETTSALAFKYFLERQVDWAVIETGLGGRLDSTNVVRPACCVITPVGFDHMDKLGDTIGQIAAEKAGILKPGVPVVLARQRYTEALQVLRDYAEARACPRWEVGEEIDVTEMEPLAAPPGDARAEVGWRFAVRTPLGSHRDLYTPLLGAHQVENCAAALGALDLLRQRGALSMEERALAAGVASCAWPARVEVLQREPTLILDSAHTVESIHALTDALDTHFPGREVCFVFGCSADKDYNAMLSHLAGRCKRLLTTRCDSPRAADAGELARVARRAGCRGAEPVLPPTEASNRCLSLAGATDVTCVTGSVFLAGEVRKAWQEGKIP